MKARGRVNDPPLTGTGQEMLRITTEARFAPYCVVCPDDGSKTPMYKLGVAVISEIAALHGEIRARELRRQIEIEESELSDNFPHPWAPAKYKNIIKI